MKNKLAAGHSSIIENGQDFRLINLSGEFHPGGSYLLGVVAKFLYLMIKYCKKKNLEKEKNSLEHLILQGYLISRIQPGQKKNKYFPEFPVIGIEVAVRI